MRNLFFSIISCLLLLPGLAFGLGANLKSEVTVGFIYVGPVGDHGWTYRHDIGRQQVEEAYGDKVKTMYVENAKYGPDAERVMRNLADEGADIIDVGGESTRPGASAIDVQEEIKRIEPVIKELSKNNILISCDTRNSLTMQVALDLGTKIINDVSSLNYDKNTLNLLKNYDCMYVLTHSKETPKTMQNNPSYKNVLLDIYDFFEKKIEIIRKEGIIHNKIILDPGIGFGKNLKHNLSLLKNISIFHSLGFPILVGVSRKRFIKDLSGLNDSKDRIGGTLSSSIIAIMNGVQIIRVHDVNEIIQGIKVFKKLID